MSRDEPPMPTPERSAALDEFVDDAGWVRAGMVCDDCGYDLRGQPSVGDCPECGASIEPMLWAMVLADARRPGYVLGLLSSVAASAVFDGVAYLINLSTSNIRPRRVDPFNLLTIAMMMSLCYAVVSVGVAILGEEMDRPRLGAWGVMSAVGGLLFTVIFFAFIYMVAMP